LFGNTTASSSLIIFQRAKLSTNAVYYSSLLVHCKDILKEKYHRKVANVVWFVHDNAPAHRELAELKKLAYLSFQCLDHPLSSPYMATSDHRLFPGLKKQFKGGHFSSDREAIAAAATWLDGQTSDFY
jgi:hypothetical protein